jgi:hypothetical protein
MFTFYLVYPNNSLQGLACCMEPWVSRMRTDIMGGATMSPCICLKPFEEIGGSVQIIWISSPLVINMHHSLPFIPENPPDNKLKYFC